MKCPRCRQDNPPQSNFCLGCGARVGLTCAACEVDLPSGSRFCNKCGSPVSTDGVAQPRYASPETYTPKHLAEKILTSKAALEGERKQVTVLFADLKGSMELLADRDPEEARKLLDPVLERMMEAVHRYEGTVNQVMGDGIMALFGAPLAHEDHAVRACYAALRMQETVKRYAEGVRREEGATIRIRVGLNSGEVVVRAIGNDLHMDYTAVGQTTHLAARMERLAEPGTSLLTPATLALCEDFVQLKSLGPIRVKGLNEAVEAYELVGANPVRSRFQAHATRGLTKFVGRTTEIAQLGEALDLSRGSRGQVVAVVGEPGVGKSRLFWEFAHSHRVDGCLIVEAPFASYDKATAYLPVIELLRDYFQIEPRDDMRKIREKVIGKLFSLDRVLEPALPAFLALLDVPVDDETWTRRDPPQRRQQTLEAVKRLLLRESQVQPLVVIFEDLHWIDGETQALLDSFVESLPTARVLLLVNYRPEYQHGWSSRTFYRQLRVDPLGAASAGELLEALLGNDPTLRTLQPLLIERTEGNPFFLEECVRTLVETHVLEGERGAYRLTRAPEVLRIPSTAQAILAARIDRLASSDKPLLQAASVTYRGLLQERRRAIHARLVEVIEQRYADRVPEHLEQLAHHVSGEAWEKALTYLRGAGLKARNRPAYAQAVGYLERAREALDQLPAGVSALEQRLDLLLELRSALHPLTQNARIMRCLDEALELAETLGDQGRLTRVCAAMAIQLPIVADAARGLQFAQRATTTARNLNEPDLLATANYALGYAHFFLGDYRTSSAIFTAILEHFPPGDSARFEAARLLTVISSGHWLSWSLTELGEFEAAFRAGEETRRRAEAFQHSFLRIGGLWALAYPSFVRGVLPEAIPKFERGLEEARAVDIAVWIPVYMGALGRAYALSGRIGDAMPLLEQAVDRAATGNRVCEGLLMAWLSDGLLLAGRSAEAGVLALKAVQLCRDRQERGHEAHATWTLGNISSHGNAPDSTQAADHYEHARVLADELGMRPLVAHCHLGLGKLYRRTGQREQARDHLTSAMTMYREMDMRFWLEQAGVELKELA